MQKESITAQDACDLINEFIKLDPEAAQNLFNYRVPCNEAIQDHPSIKVSFENTVGVLGLINGMLSEDYGPICIEYEDDFKTIKTAKLVDLKGYK